MQRSDDDSQPFGRRPAVFSIKIEHALDDVTLLGAVVAVIDHEFGLDVVVRDQLPAALRRGGDDLRMTLAKDAVDRAARRHLGLVENVVEPPDADAVAVFAPGVIVEIGNARRQQPLVDRRPAREIRPVVVLRQLPVFEVERDHQRQPLAVRPLQRLALRHRHEVVEHFGVLHRITPVCHFRANHRAVMRREASSRRRRASSNRRATGSPACAGDDVEVYFFNPFSSTNARPALDLSGDVSASAAANRRPSTTARSSRTAASSPATR